MILKTRTQQITTAKKKKFDLIIIGGGITGAGVCREAAMKGLSFILLEKNDFAFGTSSRSSKLIHGGLRYLNNGQFKVVRESCTERNWIKDHFPNLVRPLAFNLYSYEDYMYSPLKNKLAFFLYHQFSDTFSKFKNFDHPHILTKEDFLRLEPHIRKDKLKMGGYYYDFNVDDARLTLETIKEALNLAKDHSFALNYCKVLKFLEDETGKVNGVQVTDEITRNTFDLQGTQVINTTGIFTDELLRSTNSRKFIRPTKGVHLVIKNDRLGNQQAFGLQSNIDHRFYFILRREKYTIIGTTDTDYQGDLDNPECTKEDCDYLLEGVNFLFPNAHLTENDLISTFAGIRPLVIDPKTKSESKISRKHEIIDHSNGMVSLIGGKLTIFRLMAEELLLHLVKKGIFPKFSKSKMKKKFSMQPYQVGMKKTDFDKQYADLLQQNQIFDVEPNLKAYLYRQYGRQAYNILKIIQQNPTKAMPLDEDNLFCEAEIEWICNNEAVVHLIDIITRRTEMWLFVHHTKIPHIATKVALIVQPILQWSEEQTKNEISITIEIVNHWVWF